MPEQAESVLLEKCVHAWESHSRKHISVRHLGGPFDVKDALEVPHVECVETSLLASVKSPGLTTIKEGAQ